LIYIAHVHVGEKEERGDNIEREKTYSYFARNVGEAIASSMVRRETGTTPFGGGSGGWRR